MSKQCLKCNAPVVEEILTHDKHISETNFNDLSEWRYLNRCERNHFIESEKAVTPDEVKAYQKAMVGGK